MAFDLASARPVAAPRPAAPSRDLRPEPAQRQQAATTVSTEVGTRRTGQTIAQSAQSFPVELARQKADAEKAQIELDRLKKREAAGELDLKEQQSINAARAILMSYGETLYRKARAGGYEPTSMRNRAASIASGLPVVGENLGDFIRDLISEQGITGERQFTEGALRTVTGAGGPKEERPQTVRDYFPTPWQSQDPEARRHLAETRLAQLGTAGQVAGPALVPSAKATIAALSAPRRAPAQKKLPRVRNNADFDALPSGAEFIDPNAQQKDKTIMGWQDAPLAKPSSGKAKWESAPLAAPAKGPKLTPGVAAAYRELEQRYPEGPKFPAGVPDVSGIGERVTEGATLGGYGYGVRNLAKGRVAAFKAFGAKMPYTADEYYAASQLFDANRREKYAKEHSVEAFIGDVGGGAIMPGGEAVGEFVTGAKALRLAAAGTKIPLATRFAQGLRLSGVGSAMGATQGALQARPGEAGTEAVNMGTMGAILAPTVGALVPAAIKTGTGLYDIASRIVKPRTAMQLASEKLGSLLQRAQVAPAAIRDALEHYNATGAIEPSVYDVLRKAGGGPDILKFFQISGAYPATRAAAATRAAETTKALQSKALEATRKLPTSGETRTPSQIREAQAAEAARVKQETEQAMADATRTTEQATAGVAPAPTGPERGLGAKELYTDLNTAYDASKAAYEAPFKIAQDAHPESALIPDAERSPTISAIISNLGHLNDKVPEIRKIALMIEDLRLGRSPDAPTTLPPLSESDALRLKNIKYPVRRDIVEAEIRKEKGLDTPVASAGSFDGVRPLTVQQMWDTREALGNIADNTKSANVLRIVARGKEAIDTKLDQLLADDKITGDPAVVNAWREGLNGYFQHQSKFGSGLAADLTARVPGKPELTVIKPYQVGDVIFGKGETPRNLNDLRAELEPIIDIVPNAVSAVQRELYTRVKPENLPKVQERFDEAFGGNLLPQDLTDAARAAQQRAAQVEAQNAQLLANTKAQNAQRLASTEAQQARLTGAVGLGEGLRTMPSGEFTRAVTNVPQDLRPLVQAGGRQQLINMLEKPEPGSTNLFGQLQSEQSTQNLGALYGDEGAKFQQTLEGLGTQARNTQELAQSVGGETPSDITMIEQPIDLVRPRILAARTFLSKLRGKTKLSPEESMELYNLMNKRGAPDLANLARVKTVGSLPLISGPVTRAFGASREKKKSLDELSNEYGVNP